jgi:hypothetical protein
MGESDAARREGSGPGHEQLCEVHARNEQHQAGHSEKNLQVRLLNPES